MFKGDSTEKRAEIDMKKLLYLLLIFTLLLTVSCSPANRPSKSSPVTVTMWHNFGGTMQQTMDTLVDEFNSTVGKDEGIIINVTAITSGSELQAGLTSILNNDPGAPEMPDICTAYPKDAIAFQEAGLLIDFEKYFSEEDLSAYIPAFVDEGRFNNGLYVFPISKSTEVLYMNQTLFDRFLAATGESAEKLKTFEGIAQLSEAYYRWSDEQTPDIAGDGKQFFAADSWFNIAQVGSRQLGGNILDKEALSLDTDTYKYIFDTCLSPTLRAGFAFYDGYSSDLSKTGDIVCSTGSSACILFYGDTITYSDNTIENVEINIYPYPIFEGGESCAIQRGSGLIIAKSEEKREYAAARFVKWLTSSDQNIRFISSTGYLPVTRDAFETKLPDIIPTLEDHRIQKILTTVCDMYDNYSFFTAPVFIGFDALAKEYETAFKTTMLQLQTSYIDIPEPDSSYCLELLKKALTNR